MFCYKCGKENSDKSTFCEDCGAELIDDNKLNDVKKEAENEVKKAVNKSSKSISKEVVKEAGKVGVEVAKAGVKTASKGARIVKRAAIISVVVGIILTGLNFYFTYYVESPDKVVSKAMAAKEKNDIKTLVSCFDPTFQKQFEIAFNMTGGFINSLTGVNLDWSTLLSATSAFSDYLEMPVAKCNPGNYKVASISGEKLSAFVDKFGNKIPAIGNALGSEAVVEFDVDNNDQCRLTDDVKEGAKNRYSIIVRKYGSSWLIPVEEKDNLKYVSTHN